MVGEIGVRVRRRREELNLSQAAIAVRAGVGRRWWMKLEAGGTFPKPAMLEAVAKALQMDADDLIAGNLDAEMERRRFLQLLTVLAAGTPVDLERLARDEHWLDGVEAVINSLAAQSYTLVPAALLAPVEGQLAFLRSFAPGSRRLAALVSSSAQLAGRMYAKLHRPGDAYAAYALGLQAAQDAGSPTLAAATLASRSALYSPVALGHRQGDPASALAMLDAAAKLLGPGGPSRLRGHVFGRRAEEHAVMGHAAQAHRDLDTAARALAKLDDDGRSYFGPRNLAELNAIRGNVQLLLGEHEAAIVTLDTTLDGLSPQLVGWRSAVLTDSGAAFARAGDMPASVDRLERALPLALEAGDHLPRLKGVLERDMTQWARERPVRRLVEQLQAAG